MPGRLMWKQFLGADAPPVVVHRVTRDKDYQAHDHEFFEIVFITGGEGRHRSVHGEAMIGRGDVFVLQPGAWHAYAGCRATDYYDCYFNGDLLKRELVWIREDPALHALFWSGPLSADQRGIVAFHLSGLELAGCRRHLEALLVLSRQNRLARRGALLGHFLLLLDELAQSVALPQRAGAQSRHVHAAVWQGIELLQARISRAWTLTELARDVHIAPAYLVRLFKSTTGLPPLAYLARCRAERAAAMLLRTDLPSGEIGAQVGWDEPSYFARRFKAHFKVSPTEYRHRAKAQAR